MVSKSPGDIEKDVAKEDRSELNYWYVGLHKELALSFGSRTERVLIIEGVDDRLLTVTELGEHTTELIAQLADDRLEEKKDNARGKKTYW